MGNLSPRTHHWQSFKLESQFTVALIGILTSGVKYPWGVRVDCRWRVTTEMRDWTERDRAAAPGDCRAAADPGRSVRGGGLQRLQRRESGRGGTTNHTKQTYQGQPGPSGECACDNVQQIHHKKATFLGIDSSSDLMENHIRRFSVRLLANISGHKFDCNIKYPNHLHPEDFFLSLAVILLCSHWYLCFLSTQGFEGGVDSLACMLLLALDGFPRFTFECNTC